MAYPIISADSHITEPPNTYIDYIDPKLYDVVLNTGRWSVPTAADYIIDLIGLPEVSRTPDSAEGDSPAGRAIPPPARPCAGGQGHARCTPA